MGTSTADTRSRTDAKNLIFFVRHPTREKMGTSTADTRKAAPKSRISFFFVRQKICGSRCPKPMCVKVGCETRLRGANNQVSEKAGVSKSSQVKSSVKLCELGCPQNGVNSSHVLTSLDSV